MTPGNLLVVTKTSVRPPVGSMNQCEQARREHRASAVLSDGSSDILWFRSTDDCVVEAFSRLPQYGDRVIDKTLKSSDRCFRSDVCVIQRR